MSIRKGTMAETLDPRRQRRGWTKDVIGRFRCGCSMREIAMHFHVSIEEIEGIIRRSYQA